MKWTLNLTPAALALLSLWTLGCAPQSKPEPAPARTAPPTETKTMSTNTNGTTQKIVVGGGCFWCVEAVYQRIPGVKKVVSGYAGGHVENPTYEEVCTKTTGHAEVVEIEYDPAQVKLDHILDVFFVAHDPTTLNRQGADSGPQYRSVIYYANDPEKAAAESAKQRAQADWKDPIVTEIGPLKKFYVAENYHQNYFNLNWNRNSYCTMVIAPKLRKLLEKGVIKE
jgi:peptide-methionine (S)-S-oxide reductase